MIGQTSQLLQLARSDTAGPIELLIGWRTGGAFDGGLMLLEAPVADELRAACQATVEQMSAAHPREHFLGSALEQDEVLVAGRDEIPDDDALLTFARQPATSLKHLTPDELRQHRPAFHAARVAHGPTGLTLFLSKADPQVSARSGRFFSMWSGDALTRLEQPLFQFRTRFDLLAIEEVVFALGSFAFDQLFREVPLTRVKPLVAQLANVLPLAPGAAAVLEQKGLTSARVRNRLRILMSRPHLSKVTVKEFERELRRHSIPSAGIIAKGQFVVDEQRPTLLLELLDEDVWRGGFSGTLFASERKAPR